MHIENNNVFDIKELNFEKEFGTNNITNPIKLNNVSKQIQNEDSYEEICKDDFDEDINKNDFQGKNLDSKTILSSAPDTQSKELEKTLDEILNFIENNPEAIGSNLNECKPNLIISEPSKEEEEALPDVPIIPDNIDISILSEIIKPVSNTQQEQSVEYSDNFNINEQIESSNQGKIGDCWLLAGLNSLSFSESGKQIIKDSIENNGNNTYTVNFKGVNKSYTFTSEDLDKARQSEIYSTGDDDVLLMEIATEAFLKELQDGKIKLPKDAPDFLYDEGKNPLTGGFPSDFIYLLTGKNMKYENIVGNDGNYLKGTSLENFYNNNLEDFYTQFKQNPNNTCGCLHICKGTGNKDVIVEDINNQKVVLTNNGENHAWSVKKVDEYTVTMVNPWNSSKEITVLKKDIEPYILGFEYITL